MIERIKRIGRIQINWYSLIALMVYLMVVLILTGYLIRLDRGLQLGYLRAIAFLAGAVGLIFTHRFFKRPFLRILISILGAIVIVFGIIGGLFQSAIEILRSLSDYLSIYWQYVYFESVQTRPNTDLIDQNWNSFRQASGVLLDRLRDWLTSLPNPAYDPVSLNLVWGFILWFVSLWLFWYIVHKKKVLLGFVPSILILAGVYRTTGEAIYNLWIVLGFGLILAILANFSQREDIWHQNQFSVAATIRPKTTRYSILLSLILVATAATLSSEFLDDLIEDWRERREQTAASVQGEEGRNSNRSPEEEGLIGPEKVLDDVSEGLLPNVHLIGSSPDLADIEIMSVHIEEVESFTNRNYYLRSATYENYFLDGWQANHKGNVVIPPEETFEIDFTPNERLIFQEVTLVENYPQGNLMYLVGELSAANVTTTASYHTKFVNNTFTDLFAIVTESTKYAAYSKVPAFGENELRSASNEYPDWIENKYLQLPDTVPDRVVELALDLTVTQPTPYDRALAIESYLRQFEYSLDIEDPPRYQDIVDYFLFEIQTGYCDYFASSMVVLSRAAGIPARLVTGYLASTYDPDSDQYIVTADQAHSWVEVYFPEYGWVTFEPTSGRSAIMRPEEREEIPEDLITELNQELIDSNQDQTASTILPRNLFVLVGQIIILLTIGLIAFQWIEKWMLSRMSRDRMFALLYRRMQRIATGLGVKIKDTNTPLEFSEALSAYLTQLSSNRIFSKILNSTLDNVKFVIYTCNQAAYTNDALDEEEIVRVISAWGTLRRQLILARILIRLQPFSTEMRRIWTRLQQPA